jgi:predicted ATP-grasp superfamily ATP-dependent carboligase
MGAIMTAKVVDEHDINVLLAALAQRLNVTGLVNVEVARCHRTGQPRVYEINPRPSAAFAFLCYQGVDVMSDLLVSFQGGALRPRRFQPMLVKRVWSQLHDA